MGTPPLCSCVQLVLGAADVGANHQRDRIWIVAERGGYFPYTQHDRIRRWEQQQESVEKEIIDDAEKNPFPNTNCTHEQRGGVPIGIQQEQSYAISSCWWEVEPNVGRVADGVDAWVDKLKAIGNGQVPLCAATAWKILSKNVIDARLGRY